MSFARQKRLLIGWLALLAPLPLPFSEQLEWAALAAYLAVVALFLRRAAADPGNWLPNWAMNVLGLAYLPFLWLDFAVLFRGQAVRPLLHLALYLLVVKLFALQREADKWHGLLLAFFLFLAAMGTSVHPTVVLYLVGYLALTLLVLARFAYLNVLTSFGHRDHEPVRFPLRGFVAASTLAVIAGSVPLFLILPRLRAPYVMGRGSGGSGLTQAAGFSDEMSLDVASMVRDNPAIALRMEFKPARAAAREVRLRAGTYDRFAGIRWSTSPRRELGRGGGGFRLVRGKPVGSVHIWRQRLDSASLPLPEEALGLEVRRTRLLVDEGGAVSTVDGLPGATLDYEVPLAAARVQVGVPPIASADPGATLALDGVTAEMTALAARVMAGAGDDRQRAERLQSYLIANYSYTLDFVGRGGADPLGDFLFRYRGGHCELFASSMVLLLRSQGIPARLVTGFLGGEDNPLEGFFIVRHSNAHAWVEAYLGEELGWQTFDPTPPAGRPGTQLPSFALLAQQAYDFLIFRWDRYVLTYGFYDQLDAFTRLRGLWLRLQRLFEDDEPAALPVESVPAAAEDSPEALVVPAAANWLPIAVVVMTIAGLLLLWWRSRPPLTATAAYSQLRRRLAAHGLPVAASTAPLTLRARAVERFPAISAPAERIVDLYLGESFDERALVPEEREELERVMRELPELLKRSA